MPGVGWPQPERGGETRSLPSDRATNCVAGRQAARRAPGAVVRVATHDWFTATSKRRPAPVRLPVTRPKPKQLSVVTLPFPEATAARRGRAPGRAGGVQNPAQRNALPLRELVLLSLHRPRGRVASRASRDRKHLVLRRGATRLAHSHKYRSRLPPAFCPRILFWGPGSVPARPLPRSLTLLSPPWPALPRLAPRESSHCV